MPNEIQHPLTKTLSRIIEATVYYPDDLKITEVRNREALSIFVRAHTADQGLLIGGGGRQARAFRFICQVVSKMLKQTIAFYIDESFVGSKDPVRQFVPNPNYDERKIEQFVADLIELTMDSPIPLQTTKEGYRINVLASVSDADQEQVLRAIGDVIWPLGFRNGVKIWLKPAQKVVNAK